MEYLFDQTAVKIQLRDFFKNDKADISNFGSTVNQTFEAYVFANVIKWYKVNGWSVSIINPIVGGRSVFKLKYNTRGAPINYSFANCTKNGNSCQIRHGLRIYTKSHKYNNTLPANIVCDIAVIEDINIEAYSSESAIPNENLIAFGEVKHMSAFAELVASFIGMVHELKPASLKSVRNKTWVRSEKISCFLYVSGILYKTAKGISETIVKRKYDIDIYSFDNPMS